MSATGPASPASPPMPATPMFPLGTVVVPGQVVPLHVFEDRYRVLVRHCLDAEASFGTVLIERGSEVGGVDVRTDVGSRLRISEAAELADGRWVLATVATGRVRIERWLADEPYPRAEVIAWPDDDDEDPGGSGDPGRVWTPRFDAVVSSLRRVLARSAELGDDVAASTIEISDAPRWGSFQVTAAAPLGPVDRQALLASPGLGERLGALEELLADLDEVLDARLGLR